MNKKQIIMLVLVTLKNIIQKLSQLMKELKNEL